MLNLLGYDRARNYDASMFEWANREDAPMESELEPEPESESETGG